jgi:tRNA (adenine22-N1)-methyltransferase
VSPLAAPSVRIGALAAAVLPGRPCADIGTDGAALPLHLLATRQVPLAIGVDVAPAALDAARARARPAAGRLELRLGDGFAPLAPGEVATAVIAGMGGHRIAGILARGGAALRSVERLVLSPHADADVVRAAARGAGLALDAESLLSENGQWYVVLVYRWARAGEALGPATPADDAWGPLLRARRDPALRAFLGAELQRQAQACVAARQGGASVEALARLHEGLSAIEQELARLAFARGG